MEDDCVTYGLYVTDRQSPLSYVPFLDITYVGNACCIKNPG